MEFASKWFYQATNIKFYKPLGDMMELAVSQLIMGFVFESVEFTKDSVRDPTLWYDWRLHYALFPLV